MNEGTADHRFRDRIVIFICLNILFVVHTWHVQRDIITFAIKSHFSARQQTQLRQFFGAKEDPVFVFSEQGELVFHNTPGLNLFTRRGSIDISLSQKVFTF